MRAWEQRPVGRPVDVGGAGVGDANSKAKEVKKTKTHGV